MSFSLDRYTPTRPKFGPIDHGISAKIREKETLGLISCLGWFKDFVNINVKLTCSGLDHGNAGRVLRNPAESACSGKLPEGA